MSIIDGTDGPLTLGQALVELAQMAPWGDETKRDECVRTFHAAFPDDVTPIGPAPSTGVTDPLVSELNNQAIALAKQGQELAELKAKLAEAQLAEARAQLAAINAGVNPSDVGVTNEIHGPAAAGPVDLGAAAARVKDPVPLGDGAVVTEEN